MLLKIASDVCFCIVEGMANPMNSEYPDADMGADMGSGDPAKTEDTTQDLWDQPEESATQPQEQAAPLPAPEPSNIPEASNAPAAMAPSVEATQTSPEPVAIAPESPLEASKPVETPAPESNTPEANALDSEPLPNSLEGLLALDIQRLQTERDRLQQELETVQASLVDMVR